MAHLSAADRFRTLVEEGDADGLRRLLAERPETREQLDRPAFGFAAPALVFSVGAGRRDVAEVLLEAGADVDARSEWDGGPWSALHHAVLQHRELVPLLLEHGATVDVHSAAGLGDLERLVTLLDEDRDRVREPGPDGQQPLHLAADVATVDVLLERGAALDAPCIDHGSTPAQWAIGSRPEVSRALLDRGARPDVFLAAALGDGALLERLVDEDPACLEARLGQPDYPPVSPGNILEWQLGWWTAAGGAASPRRIAWTRGYGEFLERWDRLAPDWLLLVGACECGERLAAIERAGKSPGLAETIPARHRRVLADRAWDGDLAAVEACLAVGMDPQAPGDHDSTPLDRAAFHGFAEIVRALLGADPDPPLERRNEFGGTPLSALVYGALHGWRDDGDRVAAATLLLEAGAEVSGWSLTMAPPELGEVFAAHGHPRPRWALGHRAGEAMAKGSGGLELRVPGPVRDDPENDVEGRRRVAVELRVGRRFEVEWAGTFVLDEGWWSPAHALFGPPLDDGPTAIGSELAPGTVVSLDWPVLEVGLPIKICLAGRDDVGRRATAETVLDRER